MARVDRSCIASRIPRTWAVALLLVLALILVPFALWGAAIESWGETTLAATHSPLAGTSLVVGLLAADVFLPVPSSLLAVGAGHQLGLLGGAVTVWLGLMLGCWVGYIAGRLAGLPGLRRLAGEAELERARSVLESPQGVVGFGASRAVPVLSEAVVLLAGATGMRIGIFLRAAALANAGVALAYAAIGAASAAMGSVAPATVGGIVLPVLAVYFFPRWFWATDPGDS